MTARAFHRRLEHLTRRGAGAAGRVSATNAAEDQTRAGRAAFLGLVPADLRAAVAGVFADPDRAERLAEWVLYPFARWAAPPAGFEFPRPLVDWLLAPPRGWFLGHACERCGLAVPLLTTWSNDPTPPQSMVVFPACPACGGQTSWAANWWTEPPR
ncbi:MAG TPA: hypothetical protein VH092_25760 [Urbifossiella sp.]|jgi:hypothetical protein|nr:hypothetical protein [Urbifossiella sp.]